MKSARFLLLALLQLQVAAGVASAQAPRRVRAGSPPIDSVRVTFGTPEKTIAVTGYVLDKASRRLVPNVSVLWSDYPRRQARTDKVYVVMHLPVQAQTDAKGHFVLHLPAESYKTGQLLTVHTRYYEGSVALPANPTRPVKLLLQRNTYRFKPYGCQHPADSARITSPYATGPMNGLPRSQYAFLIRDSAHRPPYKLRAVTLRIGNGWLPRELMRLHVYRCNDDPEAPPGKELTNENFWISSATEGEFSFDLSTDNVTISENGFFLVLEYPEAGDGVYTRNPISNYTPTGPVLHPPCARTDIRTWEDNGHGWHRATALENCWPVYESALSMEVEPAPSGR